MSSDIASIEEIIGCAREGRPYILVDAEDRRDGSGRDADFDAFGANGSRQ